jgi:hypothetical protein
MKMSKDVIAMSNDPKQPVANRFHNSINQSIRVAARNGLYRPAIIICLLNAVTEVIILTYVPQDVEKVINQCVETLRERVAFWQAEAEKRKATIQ